MKPSIRQPLILAAASALLLAACNNGPESTATAQYTTTTTEPAAKPVATITLTDVPPSPEFPGAQLTLSSATATKAGPDSAKVAFAFSVKNYELKHQTSDAGGKLCSNSDKGQHIHFILDNMPYVALYEPKHEVTLKNNTEHNLICFLSRSYHESIKSKGASVVYNFKIDEAGKLVKTATPKTPMLFYSRPKGDYLGKDTANILLDFYLANARLGTGQQIKTDIKNETTGAAATFNLKEWKPKFIQNLGTGKCLVTLTLVNKNGTPIAGSNTTMSRRFTLSASEPLK